MPTYAAFLRGINLGRRRVTNVDLCAAFEDIGLGEPRPFLASGNVVFDAVRAKPDALQRKIERGLASALGYEVTTFVRTAEQVRTIAAHTPFASPGAGKLQVMVLAKPPTSQARREVMALATGDDQLAFAETETELYWLPAGRMSDSMLDVGRIEKTIGPTTTRTHQTMVRLTAKYLLP